MLHFCAYYHFQHEANFRFIFGLDLGLEGCIEHVWRDTIVYLNDSDPIMIGRAYGRVSRHLLHEELLKR